MCKIIKLLIAVLLAAVVGGCASMDTNTRQRQKSSMLSYLFPGAEQSPPVSDQVAVINVPFRIGVAFVPDNDDPKFRLPESDRLKLAGEVRDAFSRYPFISEIQTDPSMYLEPSGGFENLNRIAALLKLDVIALVSFDQTQHSGATGWSFLYWTGIGAYVINGDRYDVLTAVDTAVLDIKSRRLLMHATGISNFKGTATMIGFTERAREARTHSFEEAIKEMIGKLHVEVKAFRERSPKDPTIRLVLPPGYNPNANNPTPK